PDRLYIDLAGARLHPNLIKTQRIAVGDGLLDAVRISQHGATVVRVVLDFKKVKEHRVFYIQDPKPAHSARLVIDVQGESTTPRPSTTVAPGGTAGAEPFPTLAPGESDTPTPTPTARPVRVADAAPTPIVIAERSPTPTSSASPTPTPSPSPTRSPTP